jgi:uncharacterized protein YggE
MKTIHSILFLLVTSISLGQDINLQNIPQLQTIATYTQEVYADKIILSIALSEADTKGKISVEELEQRMKKVLLDNGIDIKKQLTLTNMASDFRDYFLKKTDVQKVKNYELVIFDALTAGKILKGLEKKEISNVRLLKTEYSKLEELKIELKGKAVLKAKRQAEEMLKNLDQELGPAIFISDMQTKMYPMRASLNTLVTYNGENDSNKNESLDVNFDKIKVESTITVYFKLN